MGNWKTEIKRLDVIREKLGLNWNQMEKLTGVNRQKIQRMFQLVNEPSLGFYLLMKTTLENQIKVVGKEKKEVHRDGGVSVERIKRIEDLNIVYPTGEASCDCRMDGTLFLRGKSGCKKTKDEHKF